MDTSSFVRRCLNPLVGTSKKLKEPHLFWPDTLVTHSTLSTTVSGLAITDSPRPQDRPFECWLFRAEQHGVLIAACIGCIAENLTRFVDVHRVRQPEASSGNNQGIEIDQPAGGQDAWNVFARPERLVGWGKDCRAYDLARGIDWVRSTPLCARKIS
jgi:hypothetical protein